jgi:molecular chaperone GrpE
MNKQPKPQAQTTEAENSADSAEREDPMTSFDPGDEAGQARGAVPGAAPAERAARGNGSARAAYDPATGMPQGPEGPEGSDAAAAAAEPGPAEPAAGPSELEQARQEAAESFERALRLQAEFENYKKRVAKEHAESLRYALSPLVTDVASALDNLERAIEHARKEPGEGVAALVAGIEMVLKHLYETLARYGVKRIEAVGKPFDPAQHEAINVVETDEVPANQVLDVYQAGYLLHDRVIRPARVSVSKRLSDAGNAAPPPGS